SRDDRLRDDRRARFRGSAQDRQPCDRTLQMTRQPLAPARRSVVLSFPALRTMHADRTAPLVEDVEDVGLAVLDPDRPTAGALRVVALHAAVDAAVRHLERHTALGPAAHALECRSDDADEMAVVLAGQVGFERAAVLVGAHSHRTSPAVTGTVAPARRTSSAPVSSIPAVTPRSAPPSDSSATGAPVTPTASCCQRAITVRDS